MSKEPLVSIIIATCNRPELLKKALSSALMQDYVNLEIIVTDDGLDEQAGEICDSFADARIKFVKNTTHAKSPNGNKNNGFDVAKGDFLCLLDDDDELISNSAVSQCMAHIGSVFDNQVVASVFADCARDIDGVMDGSVAGVSPYMQSGTMNKIDYHCGHITGEFFKVFSREFIENFRFDERSFGGENELYVRFFEKGVFYLKKPLYKYRLHRVDSATKNATKHANDVAYAYAKSAKLYYEIAHVYAPEFIALEYKMAAYYYKLGGKYALSLRYLFKSLGIKFTKEAFVMLLLLAVPNSFLPILSKIRVAIRQKFGI
ncbi:MAG: glycosyltransferase family 2 protein [Campylobacter sp.]